MWPNAAETSSGSCASIAASRARSRCARASSGRWRSKKDSLPAKSCARLTTWSSEDLNILATLFVNSMIVIAEAIEDAGDQTSLDEIKRVAVKQLRMITVGVTGWRSSS